MGTADRHSDRHIVSNHFADCALNEVMIKTMRQYHVGVVAEAFAAGLFAQSGCYVLVQYGANQPLYDLVIACGGKAIHMSSKGNP